MARHPLQQERLGLFQMIDEGLEKIPRGEFNAQGDGKISGLQAKLPRRHLCNR
jgi:hypothetical protein